MKESIRNRRSSLGYSRVAVSLKPRAREDGTAEQETSGPLQESADSMIKTDETRPADLSLLAAPLNSQPCCRTRIPVDSDGRPGSPMTMTIGTLCDASLGAASMYTQRITDFEA